MMASVTPMVILSRLHHKRLKLQESHNLLVQRPAFIRPHPRPRHTVRSSKAPPWEPSPVSYASEDTATLSKETPNIFETMSTCVDVQPDEKASSVTPFHYLRQPLWLLGPGLLLLTGVVPTLWLPIASIYLGPNIASILTLTGLDCIFNLGASLFLLMADSIARPNNITNRSKPPLVYRFANIAANVIGLLVPLAVVIASRKGFVGPEMPLIPLAILLGPYYLLVLVQMITEMLTWQWQSPVWLVTPVIYEAYRLLQLMRGLKVGVEVGAPLWMMHMVKGLVCGWVVVLGVQLMSVAWHAAFTKHQSTA